MDDIVTVSEESIVEAMRYIWERLNMIIEASCAVPVAAVFEKKVDVKGKKVGIIITGGNVDLDNLPWWFDFFLINRNIYFPKFVCR